MGFTLLISRMAIPRIDFLIIGAQKGGTTTLDAILEQHPALYLAPVKELNYFALGGKSPDWQGPGDRSTATMICAVTDEQYSAHFKKAKRHQKLGESSVLYLYNATAPAAIHAHNPAMKLIVVLREPAKRAYSAFCHLLRDGREFEEDFRKALALEPARIQNRFEQLWHYRASGEYGDQLERYLELFPREQLLVLTSDMFDDLPAVARRCYEFLGVDAKFRPDCDITMNVSGAAKSQSLNQFLGAPHPLKNLLKRIIPLRYGRKVKGWVSKRNLKPMPACPPAILAELRAYYRPQVEKTERLTGLDLSAWK